MEKNDAQDISSWIFWERNESNDIQSDRQDDRQDEKQIIEYPDYENTEPIAVHGITNNCSVVIYSLFDNENYEDSAMVAWQYNGQLSELEECVINYDKDGEPYINLGGIVLMMSDFIRV